MRINNVCCRGPLTSLCKAVRLATARFTRAGMDWAQAHVKDRLLMNIFNLSFTLCFFAVIVPSVLEIAKMTLLLFLLHKRSVV